MRNRAKCKKCSSVIESFHATDYISCNCGEIAVDGGPALRCYANNYENFLRVDDEGNEIVVTYKSNPNGEKKEKDSSDHKPDKKELLDMLEEMIKSYERLPEHVMFAPITHADYLSGLLLLFSILRSERNALS